MAPEQKAELLQQTISSLQADLQREREAKEALIAEFSKAETYEEQVQVAKDAIAELLPEAVTTMKSLMANSDKDAVRAGLAKYVFETVLSGKLQESGNKTVDELLRKLTEQPTSETPITE